jgi:hypothetical protein
MSTKPIDNEAFYGFRVRRTVNGKLYQEYYSLKKDGKRMGRAAKKAVRLEAEARDEVLRLEQVKSKLKRKAELCFKDGKIKGINYLKKTEKSGNVTPIFQIGIHSEIKNKIFCTSFSCTKHGFVGAWDLAVDAFAKHKKIKKGSKLYVSLKAAILYYGKR